MKKLFLMIAVLFMAGASYAQSGPQALYVKNTNYCSVNIDDISAHDGPGGGYTTPGALTSYSFILPIMTGYDFHNVSNITIPSGSGAPTPGWHPMAGSSYVATPSMYNWDAITFDFGGPTSTITPGMVLHVISSLGPVRVTWAVYPDGSEEVMFDPE